MFNTTKKALNLESLAEWKSKNNITDEASSELSTIITSNFSPKRLEYCRALHAEENAILQTAILGGMGIKGGTIFSTTFPCELCAKKIYQAGLKKVVYTEPYPESISEDVFFKDGSHIVQLCQFEGVKSHSYYRLYKATVDRKEFQYQETI
jgi:deoxycytidylate deaminase